MSDTHFPPTHPEGDEGAAVNPDQSPESRLVPSEAAAMPEAEDTAEPHPEFAFVFQTGGPAAAETSPEASSVSGVSEQDDSDEVLPGNASTVNENAKAGLERFILLFRHGLAEERTEEKPDDERALTKKGAQRTKEIGRGLAEICPKLDAIFTSPLVRAIQTGIFLAKGYGGKVPVRMTEALEPGQGAEAFKTMLEAVPLPRVVFIGHEPDLTQILGNLCSLDTSAMELKKGGCYGIRINASGEARLEWMLPPSALRRIRE